MIRWFKRYLRKRAVIRKLVAYAKTPEGRIFIEEMNHNNLILADMDAYDLGAENPYIGKRLRIKLSARDWQTFNRP